MTSNIWTLSDRVVDELAALLPVDATFVGVAGHDHRWNDYSPDGIEANAAYFRELRDRINQLPVDDDPSCRRLDTTCRQATLDLPP